MQNKNHYLECHKEVQIFWENNPSLYYKFKTHSKIYLLAQTNNQPELHQTLYSKQLPHLTNLFLECLQVDLAKLKVVLDCLIKRISKDHSQDIPHS
jgi:hypothetical protein